MFDKLTSCLYIKPFLGITALDITEYIKLIIECNPDHICVGMNFADCSHNSVHTTLYNEKTSRELLDSNEAKNMIEFANIIKKSTAHDVCFSSICQITNIFGLDCYLELKKMSNYYCKDCFVFAK